jgi:hypothetical protein
MMTDCQLTLNDEERGYLVEILQRALREAQIEEHRTRTPTYREHVLHDEGLIAGLLAKLGHRAA